MSGRIVVAAVLSVWVTAAVNPAARAQQPTSAGQPAGNPSGWTFNIAPYGWFATIGTTLNYRLPPALGGTVTADPTIGFGDIIVPLELRDHDCGGCAI
jgi:hypothetical protein